MVTCAEDILEEYEIYLKKIERKIKADNETEEKILSVLSSEPTTTDEVIRQTRLDAGHVNATLTMMELKKKIKSSGKGFILFQ